MSEKRLEGVFSPTMEQVTELRRNPKRYLDEHLQGFVRDIRNLGECAANLYKESALALGLLGVHVEINVTATGIEGNDRETLASIVLGSDCCSKEDAEEILARQEQRNAVQ